MIDEKKLIEKIEKMVIPLSTPDGSESIDIGINGYNECLVDVLETIKEQPKVGEWIPCNERLPEDLMTVNVTWVNRKPQTYYSYIKDKPFTNTALRFNGKWYWWSAVTEDILREYGESAMDEIDNGIEVIAWRPLPEPYKGD